MGKVNKLTKKATLNLKHVVEQLNLKPMTKINDYPDIINGYVSDLLSDVIANADEGFVWITIQKHVNIIAVAKLKKISAIIITNGSKPEKEVMEKAEEENVILLTTNDNSFVISGKLYCLLNNNTSKEE